MIGQELGRALNFLLTGGYMEESSSEEWAFLAERRRSLGTRVPVDPAFALALPLQRRELLPVEPARAHPPSTYNTIQLLPFSENDKKKRLPSS